MEDEKFAACQMAVEETANEEIASVEGAEEKNDGVATSKRAAAGLDFLEDVSDIVSRRALGPTVTMLLRKGELKRMTPEQKEREQQALKRRRWIQKQKLYIANRERNIKDDNDRRHLALKDMSKSRDADREKKYQMEKDQSSRLLEAQLNQDADKRFKEYVPDIKLEYHDQYGRSLDPKEAFKEMSRKFHGRFSGKSKTDKVLRKIEQERKS